MAELQIAEIQQRLNFIAMMEVDAKSNHGFEKACFHSRKERESLQVLFKRYCLIDKPVMTVEQMPIRGLERVVPGG